MVSIADSFVETLDVSDEDLSLPLLGGHLRVLVVVEQESELHTTSIKDTLVALSRVIGTSSVTKDGEGEDGCANVIEAGTGLTGERCCAGGQLLDIVVGHIVQYGQVTVEVLHGRLN